MVDVKIVRKNIKHLHLRVKSSLEVVLSVPFRASARDIECILEKRREWIKKHLDKFRQNSQNTAFDSGYFWFLGRRYEIKVIHSKLEKMVLCENVLEIYLSDKSKELSMIDEYYKNAAKELFPSIVSKFEPVIKKKVSVLRIKKMKTRWGSCNHKKAYVNLNFLLLKKPIEAVEYVIFHELAHLIYNNHSKDFYAFIENFMPDYKEREMMLK